MVFRRGMEGGEGGQEHHTPGTGQQAVADHSSVIEKLDKKANVVDAIEVFMAFSKWLEHRAQTDPELTPDLIKAINKYQDKYIVESMGTSLGR